MQVGYYICCY